MDFFQPFFRYTVLKVSRPCIAVLQSRLVVCLLYNIALHSTLSLQIVYLNLPYSSIVLEAVFCLCFFQLMRTVPNTAITMGVYELVVYLLHRIWKSALNIFWYLCPLMLWVAVVLWYIHLWYIFQNRFRFLLWLVFRSFDSSTWKFFVKCIDF